MKRLFPTLTLRAVLPVVSIGCSGLVADVQRLEPFAKSVSVSDATADAWTCDVTQVPNTRGVVAECGACGNSDRRSHCVTINGERSLVEPQGTVVRCRARAWVWERPVPPLPPRSAAHRREVSPPSGLVLLGMPGCRAGVLGAAILTRGASSLARYR
jgi:hypothetical protein